MIDEKQEATLEDLAVMGITEEDCKPFLAENNESEKVEVDDENKEPVVDDDKEPVVDKPEDNADDESKDVDETESPAPDSVKSDVDDHSDNLKIALSKERAMRKEEKEKRLKLETELKKYREQIQAPAQPAQPTPIDMQTKIRNEARAKAIKDLNIEDADNLMFIDPPKYEDFIATKTRYELEMNRTYEQTQKVYNENVNFAKELSAVPEIDTIIKYGTFDLSRYNDPDEMQRKTTIAKAYAKVDKGIGSSEDINILRDYIKECQTAIKSNAKVPGAVVPNTPPTNNLVNKLNIADTLPKANQLNGSGPKASMSWEEVAKLASEQKWDQIPPGMLKILEEKGL